MEMNDIPPMYRIPEYTPTVTFKDGTVINARCGYNSVMDELWIWPSDAMTFAEATAMFSDAEKTEQIRADYSPLEHQEYEGYTELTTISTDASGKMSIRLRKPR